MTRWFATERARAALRHAVVSPNVTGRTKERVEQSKRARNGLLVTIDQSYSGAISYLSGGGISGTFRHISDVACSIFFLSGVLSPPCCFFASFAELGPLLSPCLSFSCHTCPHQLCASFLFLFCFIFIFAFFRVYLQMWVLLMVFFSCFQMGFCFMTTDWILRQAYVRNNSFQIQFPQE